MLLPDKLPFKIKNRIVVDQQTGCWLWVRAKNAGGYGVFRYRKKMEIVSRLVYTLVTGNKIPDGFEASHVCPNRNCCRPHPEHVVIETHAENMARIGIALKVAKVTLKKYETEYPQIFELREPKKKVFNSTSCQMGHEYTEENTGFQERPDGGLKRFCIQCHKERARIRRLKNYQSKIGNS